MKFSAFVHDVGFQVETKFMLAFLEFLVFQCNCLLRGFQPLNTDSEFCG